MPVDLHKATAGVRRTQALGFPKQGRHRLVVVHSFFLKLYFRFLPPAGGAELIEF
jgi:hypothetical protein